MARTYTPQKKDGSWQYPWTIAEDGKTCTDTSQPWAVVCYRLKREAQRAIDAHANDSAD